MELVVDDIYHFDKIRILSKKEYSFINNYFPYAELQGLSNNLKIGFASFKAKKRGFKTSIEITAPQASALKILADYDSFFGTCNISYIEIAHDQVISDGYNYKDPLWLVIENKYIRERFITSKRESIKLFEFLLNFTKKNFTYEQLVYRAKRNDEDDYSDIEIENRKNDEEEKYYTKTGYWGSYNFKLAMYPRLSKMNDRPCVHSEWRIYRSDIIREKTGIISIRDLVNFDIEEFMSKQKDRQLKLVKINYEKLGRWLNEIPAKVKTRKYFGKRKRLYYDRAARAGQGFCSYLRAVNGIETSAELWCYLKKELKMVPKMRGRRNRWKTKLQKLTRYRLNSFFENGGEIMSH
tara:strand:- start:13 stop:1065 length:1053 start_codon:yes stop_codon:yes gene_type:complete